MPAYDKTDQRTDKRPQDGPEAADDGIGERPGLASVDWDEVQSASVTPERPSDGMSGLAEPDPDGELPGEDEDNPFMDPDEALPDDREERVLRRDPGKEGGRFDEV